MQCVLPLDMLSHTLIDYTPCYSLAFIVISILSYSSSLFLHLIRLINTIMTYLPVVDISVFTSREEGSMPRCTHRTLVTVIVVFVILLSNDTRHHAHIVSASLRCQFSLRLSFFLSASSCYPGCIWCPHSDPVQRCYLSLRNLSRFVRSVLRQFVESWALHALAIKWSSSWSFLTWIIINHHCIVRLLCSVGFQMLHPSVPSLYLLIICDLYSAVVIHCVPCLWLSEQFCIKFSFHVGLLDPLRNCLYVLYLFDPCYSYGHPWWASSIKLYPSCCILCAPFYCWCIECDPL